MLVPLLLLLLMLPLKELACIAFDVVGRKASRNVCFHLVIIDRHFGSLCQLLMIYFTQFNRLKTVCDKHTRCRAHSARHKKDVEIGLACVPFAATHAALLLLLAFPRLSLRCTVMEIKMRIVRLWLALIDTKRSELCTLIAWIWMDAMEERCKKGIFIWWQHI